MVFGGVDIVVGLLLPCFCRLRSATCFEFSSGAFLLQEALCNRRAARASNPRPARALAHTLYHCFIRLTQRCRQSACASTCARNSSTTPSYIKRDIFARIHSRTISNFICARKCFLLRCRLHDAVWEMTEQVTAQVRCCSSSIQRMRCEPRALSPPRLLLHQRRHRSKMSLTAHASRRFKNAF